jgi:hypothetical protein
VPRAEFQVNRQVDGDGFGDAAAGCAAAAGGGDAGRSAGVGRAECRQGASEGLRGCSGKTSERGQRIGGRGSEHVVPGEFVGLLIFVVNQVGRTASTSPRVRWLAWASRGR